LELNYDLYSEAVQLDFFPHGTSRSTPLAALLPFTFKLSDAMLRALRPMTLEQADDTLNIRCDKLRHFEKRNENFYGVKWWSGKWISDRRL